MNGWFLVIIIIDALNIGMNLAKHGEDKDAKYNFFASLIGCAINLTLIIMAIKVGF